MKKLTVVIPAYNAKDYIIRTLSSLIKQDLKEVEILVVNDGSTDATQEVVETYFKDREYVDHKIIEKPNGGVSSARNVGIQNANGEYIFFLDSDDYVSEDFIYSLMEKINNGHDIITWKYDNVNDDGFIIKSYDSTYGVGGFCSDGITALREIIIDKNYGVWTGSAIYKKDFLIHNNLIFEVNCSAGEDLEFIYKAFLNAESILHIDKTMSFYVHREGSVINSFNVNKYDSVYAMERVCEYIKNGNFKNSVEIANKIYEEETINHYINTTMTFFMYSDSPSNKKLFSQINAKYPDLVCEMNNRMKNYRGDNLKQTFKVKLFRRSPNLLFVLTNLNSKLNM